MLAGVDLIAFQPFQVLVLIVAFSLRQIVVVVSTLHVLGQPSILLGNLSHIAQIRLFYRLSEETKGNKSILKVLITQRGGRQWPWELTLVALDWKLGSKLWPSSDKLTGIWKRLIGSETYFVRMLSSSKLICDWFKRCFSCSSRIRAATSKLVILQISSPSPSSSPCLRRIMLPIGGIPPISSSLFWQQFWFPISILASTSLFGYYYGF